MEATFTLPYSEFEVINTVQKFFKKSDGYSVYIPVSRQQKGIDFIVHNYKTNKILTFQVKSSRTYEHEVKELENGETKPPRYRYHLWLNNFIEKYERGHCDYYILFGLYAVYTPDKNIKDKFWKTILLCYSESEMFDLLDKIKTKREGKTDKFFTYAFDSGNKIFNDRGLPEAVDASEHLLRNKIGSILKEIGNKRA